LPPTTATQIIVKETTKGQKNDILRNLSQGLGLFLQGVVENVPGPGTKKGVGFALI